MRVVLHGYPIEPIEGNDEEPFRGSQTYRRHYRDRVMKVGGADSDIVFFRATSFNGSRPEPQSGWLHCPANYVQISERAKRLDPRAGTVSR